MRSQLDFNPTTDAGEDKFNQKFEEMGITTPPPLTSRTMRIDIGTHKIDERFLFTSTPNRDMALAYLCSELRATNKTMVIYVWTAREIERVTQVLRKLGTAAATPLRTDDPQAARAAALESPVIVTTDDAASLTTTTTPPLTTTTTPPLSPPLPRVDYTINFDLLVGWWKNPPLAPIYARRFAAAVFSPGGSCDGVITFQSMGDKPGVVLLGRPERVYRDMYPIDQGRLADFKTKAQLEGVDLDGLQPEPILVCRQWPRCVLGRPSEQCTKGCRRFSS